MTGLVRVLAAGEQKQEVLWLICEALMRSWHFMLGWTEKRPENLFKSKETDSDKENWINSSSM